MGNRREFPFGLIDKLKINKIYYVRKKNNLPVPCAHERGRNGIECYYGKESE